MTKPTHVYFQDPAFTVDPLVKGLTVVDASVQKDDIGLICTLQLSHENIAVLRAVLDVAGEQL